MRVIIGLICLLLAGPVWADWAVVANSNATLSIVHLREDGSNEVSGPFLAGALGTAEGGTFDVEIVPYTRTALVSNFGDKTVFFVDLSDPTAPVVLGSVAIGLFAEDIALTPDGGYALVTDGGISPTVAIIDVRARALIATHTLAEGHAQAVAVAPDGQTVILVDYSGRQIIYGRRGGATGLTALNLLPTQGFPINVTISPDGRTVLVAIAAPEEKEEYFGVNVFRITGPGVVVPGDPAVIAGLPQGSQSIVFSSSGEEAYVLASDTEYSGPLPDQLSSLLISGPGQVSLQAAEAATLLSMTNSQLFGVDTITRLDDGRLLVSNPSISGAVTSLALVTPGSWTVTPIPMPADVDDPFYPLGIAQMRSSGGEEIPTLNEWGLIIMSLVLGILSVRAMKNRGLRNRGLFQA